MMADTYRQLDLIPTWSPPKFAIAPNKSVEPTSAHSVVSKAALKRNKKKRKRDQGTIADDVLSPSKLAKIEDEPEYSDWKDPILAACHSEVIQGLDYPQHRFCVQYLQCALDELEQVPHVPMRDFPPPEPDNFDDFIANWKALNHNGQMLDIVQSPAPVDQLWNRPVRQRSDSAVRVRSANADWIIPPRSSFLMSDISSIELLQSLKPPNGFNLVVLDPPWENKSVFRGQKYQTLSLQEILHLPVHSMLAEEEPAVVMCWVTNKLEFQRFVVDSLFPSWGVEYSTSWFWLKVKTDGHSPVCPLDAKQRKPYEVLLLGTKNVGRARDNSLKELLARPKVLCATPSAHSRKPPLHDLVAPFLSSNVRGLELFARNLLPNFTSWGNEVIKFNESKFFSPKLPA